MMSEEKLRSDEVPPKLTEWLLYMGCSADKIPSADKVTQMCCGQYYMVWRNLMERVQSKDIIKNKRAQWFYDAVKKSESREHTIIPVELEEWRKYQKVKKEVEDAEKNVEQSQQKLTELMDKVSSKLSQCGIVRSRVQDAQRRVLLLQAAGSELAAKRDSLLEMQALAADVLRPGPGEEGEADVQAKLDKCIAVFSQPSAPAASLSLCAATPVSCSSVVSTCDDDAEEHLEALARCPAPRVWALLLERRAALARALAADQPGDSLGRQSSITPQSVAAHTAAMHCVVSLETVKCKIQLKQTTMRLESAISDLSETLSGPACELAVLRFERASAEARVATMRAILEDVQTRRGLFSSEDDGLCGGDELQGVAQLDRAIIAKKEETKALLVSLARTERRILRAREAVLGQLAGLQRRGAAGGLYLDLERDSTAEIRQFYEEWRERRDLSMDLDTSENGDLPEDIEEPTFADELRFYLKKFNLEKNRKLVLESGEKIWIFETLQASADRLHTKCLADDVTCRMLCPSVSLPANVSKLLDQLREKSELEKYLEILKSGPQKRFNHESAPEQAEEERLLETIKKRLGDNLTALQRTAKTLDLGQQNLQLWEESPWREYVSTNRTVDGKTYREYEAIHLERLNLQA